MLTHKQMIEKWKSDPAFAAELEKVEREEMPMLDAILKARKEVKMTQEQIA